MRIDPKIAKRTAKIIAGAGPSVTQAEAAAVVAELRRQAERAIPLVAEVSGLTAGAETAGLADVLVVDRAGWATAAAQSLKAMFKPSRANFIAPKPGAVERAGDRLEAEEFGLAIAGLAPRIFGQFDPYGAPRPGRLVLVAPNILEFLHAYNLDRRDVCLWVCTHELTHGAQFAAAPWLADYIISRVRHLVDGDVDEELMSEIAAIMGLLEGHAEYVMNAVPIATMPSKKKTIAAMAKRRAGGHSVQKKMYQFLGMDEKAKQYSRGVSFVSAVVEAHGLDGFNKVWENPLNAPSPSELDNPAAWARRVLG